MQTRRSFLSTVVAALAASTARALPFPTAIQSLLDDAAAQLESRSGGRLGLVLFESGSGMSYTWRGEEHFPMASTYKAMLAGAILLRIDQQKESLARPLPIRPEDLDPHAPVVESMLGQTMTVAELCEATVTLSDSAAANVLINTMGGLAGFTASLRTLGDEVTSLSRDEPDPGVGSPGTLRGITTPEAYLETMGKLLLGEVLSTASREQLLAWLVGNKTGDHRIRAGVPEDWIVGDKTGTNGRGDVHDFAILLPPARSPILVALFLSETSRPLEELELIHAEVGRLAATLI